MDNRWVRLNSIGTGKQAQGAKVISNNTQYTYDFAQLYALINGVIHRIFVNQCSVILVSC